MQKASTHTHGQKGNKVAMALDGVSFHATLSKFPLAGQKQPCLSQIWEAQRYSFKQEDSMHVCMLPQMCLHTFSTCVDATHFTCDDATNIPLDNACLDSQAYQLELSCISVLLHEMQAMLVCAD